MIIPRIIPCLLLKNTGFVKTQKFNNPVYLGDPLNILRIFNEKAVDEIFILDILASPEKRGPNFDELEKLASECFMPLGYGGGIQNLRHIERALTAGFEKVSLNTAAIETPSLIREAAALFGSQSIVISIDSRKSFFGGYETYCHGGRKKTNLCPEELAKRVEDLGAGEILINSIDRDGTGQGYDLDLISRVSSTVSIPVVACGGVGKLQDMVDGILKGGASAVAAGSFFVFQGPHRAVLINAPDFEARKQAFLAETTST